MLAVNFGHLFHSYSKYPSIKFVIRKIPIFSPFIIHNILVNIWWQNNFHIFNFHIFYFSVFLMLYLAVYIVSKNTGWANTASYVLLLCYCSKRNILKSGYTIHIANTSASDNLYKIAGRYPLRNFISSKLQIF